MKEDNQNPFLQPENPYDGYKDSIENLKNKPEAVEFDKLCYFAFKDDNGKKLLEVFKERFLIPGFIHPNSPNARDGALYFEGFKEAYRMIFNAIKAHEHRIQAEVNA